MQQGLDGKDQVVVKEIVFDFPFEVEKKFFSFNGAEKEAVIVDCLPTGKWAQVVLSKKDNEPFQERHTL